MADICFDNSRHAVLRITEAGKNFFVSMDYAAPELSGTEGAAKVQAAAELILEQQPFAVTLVSCEAAELIEVPARLRRVARLPLDPLPAPAARRG